MRCQRVNLATVNTFWSADVPFIPLFGTDHLLYIGIMMVALIGLLSGRSWVRAHAEGLRWTFLGISSAQVVTLYAWYFLETGFDAAEALPLHISRISSLLGIAYLATRRSGFMDVMFYFSLFAYFTFLLPQRIYSITHVIGWSFLISHIMNILLPIFAAVAYGWRPTLPALKRAFGWFVVYFVAILVINPLVEGNYFYQRDRPIAFFQNWPDAAFAALSLAVTFAIFWLGYGASRASIRRSDAVLTAQAPEAAH